MRYLSVCSGIEAASVAWHPLGWHAVAVSEIEPFPAAVLEHRFPDVPNWGDMTRFEEWPDADVDVLVGGTPCQSFSVAGLRKGLADPRGNLALVYLALAQRYRPRWLVWENVPGVLSSGGGRDFGALLGGMAKLGYGWAYRVLDAQFFGVAQRRRRVFVVGSARGWAAAAAVLFESSCLRGDPAPRRPPRERAAPTLAARSRGGGGLGTDAELDGALIPEVVSTISEPGGNARPGDNLQSVGTLVPEVTHALRGEGFDASEDGTGRGTPLVPEVAPAVTSKWAKGTGGPAGDEAQNPVAEPIAFHPTQDPIHHDDGTTHAMGTGSRQGTATIAVAFQTRGSNVDANGEVAGTLGTNADRAFGGAPMVAQGPSEPIPFDETQITSPGNRSRADPGAPAPAPALARGARPPAVAFSSKDHGGDASEEVAPTLRAMGHADSHANGGGQLAVGNGLTVRRLTPRECERLQGFPDDWTLVEHRGAPAKDGPRYKALGNSMAVPVMAWIGRRIDEVEAITRELFEHRSDDEDSAA